MESQHFNYEDIHFDGWMKESEASVTLYITSALTLLEAGEVVKYLNTAKKDYHAMIGKVEGVRADSLVKTIEMVMCTKDEYCPYCPEAPHIKLFCDFLEGPLEIKAQNISQMKKEVETFLQRPNINWGLYDVIINDQRVRFSDSILFDGDRVKVVGQSKIK